MKKLFTLVVALMAFAGVANAATVDDLEPLKHSYVLVCDELGARPGKGVIFGANHFLDVTGGNTATNKGKVDLSVADGTLVTEEIAAKYGEEYGGEHMNFLRLKNDQDVIAMKVTAKTKIIIFYNNNGAERYPMFGADSKPTTNPIANQGTISETVNKIARCEWIADDDMTVYIGGKGGDQFLSFIIVEANEAPGSPTVKVGDQTFENGLWFREVTCKANPATEEGSDEQIPTLVTYTTDGTAPTAASPIYSEPIKCYKDMTVKFQAFLDFGDGQAWDEALLDGADNEANVEFSFDAPTIETNGASFTIVTPYAEQNGANMYSVNGEEAVRGDGKTLTESATVSAYTEIANGTYATFTSKTTTQDVYVLNPIKEKKVIAVTNAEIILDEEATATSTTGEVYKVENGEISADKMDFFVKNLEFTAVANTDYQVDGQEAYIKMNNTRITFLVAAGDVVNVKVTTSKNSCKTLNPDNDESVTTDRKNYVNVSGTNYGNDDVTAEDGNIIEFTVKGGKDVTTTDEEGVSVTTLEPADTYYTFQKYSGTGNILVASIEFTPANSEGIKTVNAAANANAALYNVAGQKVNEGFKGLVIKNGKKMIQK